MSAAQPSSAAVPDSAPLASPPTRTAPQRGVWYHFWVDGLCDLSLVLGSSAALFIAVIFYMVVETFFWGKRLWEISWLAWMASLTWMALRLILRALSLRRSPPADPDDYFEFAVANIWRRFSCKEGAVASLSGVLAVLVLITVPLAFFSTPRDEYRWWTEWQWTIIDVGLLFGGLLCELTWRGMTGWRWDAWVEWSWAVDPGSLFTRGLLLGLALSLLLAIEPTVRMLHSFTQWGVYESGASTREVRMSDGAIFVLNHDSKIRVRYYPAQRYIELLRGEVYVRSPFSNSRFFNLFIGDLTVENIGASTAHFIVRRVDATHLEVLSLQNVLLLRSYERPLSDLSPLYMEQNDLVQLQLPARRQAFTQRVQHLLPDEVAPRVAWLRQGAAAH
jgi:hypothetical protein